MTVRARQLHFNDGVARAEREIIRAFADAHFRTMDWDQIRNLIREAASRVKLPAPKPAPPEGTFPGSCYAEGKRNGWLDAYNGRRSTIALTYPQHSQPAYGSGYSDGQLAHQHGEPLPDKE